MDICLVAALSRRNAIGLDNRLLWHLPRDLRHFKSITLGRPVVMGRSTFDSIGRPLPRRRNIVLTRQRDLRIPGCEMAHDLEEALARAGDSGDEVMVIGGARVYAQAMPLATRLVLTHVESDIDGDAYFPAIDAAVWQAVSEELHDADAENPHACRFVTYVRVSPRG